MEQLSIMDYLEIKKEIKNQLNNIQSSFVVIGYRLKQVRDNGLFTRDGHKDIWEFGQKEFGLSRSTVSRFISINDRFSVDGNSPEIVPAYKTLGSSKLQEMLTIPEEYCEMIKEEHTVQDIREVKKFAKEEAETVQTPMERILAPEQTVEDEGDQIKEAIRELYRSQKLERLFNGQIRGVEGPEDVAEQIKAVTQSVFRKGKIMLFLGDYQEGISIRILGKTGKQNISWQRFCDLFMEIFESAKDYPADPWKQTYPEQVLEEKKAEKKSEPKSEQKQASKPAPKPEPKAQPKVAEKKPESKSFPMPIPEPVEAEIKNTETEQCDFNRISGLAVELISAANSKNKEKVLAIIEDLSAEIMFGSGKSEI